MLYEKKKLLFHRLAWLVLLILGIIIPVILANSLGNSSDELHDEIIFYCIAFCVFFDICAFILLIGALLLSYKKYEYNGNSIIVYSGWYHHYIKFNGKKVDEHNTLVTFNAIPLSCALDDGTDIKVTITLTNRISLKINNQLYTESK